MPTRIWSIPDLPEGQPLSERLEALTGDVYLEAGSVITPALKSALAQRGIPGFVAAGKVIEAPRQYFVDPPATAQSPLTQNGSPILLDPPHLQRLLRTAVPHLVPEQPADVAAESFLRHLYLNPYQPLDRAYLEQTTERILSWAEGLTGPPVLVPTQGRPDGWLISHVLKSTQWAAWIGVRLGLPRVLLTSLVMGALLRDVGQMAMPAEILFTEKHLDAKARETIADHPLFSVSWLSAAELHDEEVFRTIRQHHERFDGRGYPMQLPGPSLSESAQILALADTFAAVQAPRPWRPARTLAESVQALVQGAGAQFNPDLVRLFVQLIGPYPPGSILELDHRDKALVIAGNAMSKYRPRVQVIERLNGSLELRDPMELATSRARITQVLR